MAKVSKTKKTRWKMPAVKPGNTASAKGKPAETLFIVPRTAKDYDAHPSIAMVKEWIEGLKPSTGKTLEQWVKLCRTDGPKEEKALQQWLKAKHTLGTNAASWIASRAFGKGLEDGDEKLYLAAAPHYVSAMYAGPRQSLWPVHEAIEKMVRSISPQLKLCPCKTIVPVYATHVIAQIKPATRTRIDFGLALGNTKGRGRLIETGGYAKKDRITHRIELSEPKDVDGFVEQYLRQAWQRDLA